MDADTFVEHYRAYLPLVAKYLARRVDQSQVEDLCADVFEIAYRKRDQAPVGNELPWLFNIALNVTNNYRRKAGTAQKLIAALPVPVSAPSAETVALDQVELRLAWNQLKPKEQQVLALLAFDGLTISQIAQVLGTSNNSVSIRLNRARTRLGQLLSEVTK